MQFTRFGTVKDTLRRIRNSTGREIAEDIYELKIKIEILVKNSKV